MTSYFWAKDPERTSFKRFVGLFRLVHRIVYT